MPELERARPLGDRRVDGVGAEHGADGDVPRPESLGRGHDVRSQRQPVCREPAAGATETGHDLVEADEEPVLTPPLVQAAPERLRRRVGGQRRRAHRLAEEGCDGLRPDGLQHLVQCGKRRFAAGIEAPRRRRDVEVIRGVRIEGLLHVRAAGESERCDGWPVVGLRGRDDPPALGLTPLDVIAPSEPQRGFVGLGPAGHEVHPGEPRGRQLAEQRCEPLLPRAGELLAVQVGDLAGLAGGHLGDLLDAVPEAGDHGTARDRVEVLVAGAVPQANAFGPHHLRIGAVELAREDVGLA